MKNPGKLVSVLLIAAIYILVILIIYFIFPLIPVLNLYLKILLADIVATALIFLCSRLLNNSSVYDPYWSLAPLVITVFLILGHSSGDSTRQAIVLLLVFSWSARLAYNWAKGWRGIADQDWRYSDLQNQAGRLYWPVSFLGIHLMPTLLVYLGCLPLFYILACPSPFSSKEWIAVLITLFAIFLEWMADEQLRDFRRNNLPNAIMKSGLWKFIRHPNYLGEISFWLGIYLFAALEDFGHTWRTAAGFLSMVILFSLISIPMMDRHNLARRPGYDAHMKKVPALLPFRSGIDRA